MAGEARCAVWILAAAVAAAVSCDGLRATGTGEPVTVRVTGREFGWIVRYPGRDGVLASPDDVVDHRNLRLPSGARVTLDLRSDDYVYTFSVPELDVVDVAVPDQPYRLSFRTERPGTLHLMGSQMCGYTHPGLLGEVVVLPSDIGAADLFGQAR